MMNNIKLFQDAAQEAALKAGRFLKKEFKKDELEGAAYKKGHELVTEADKKAEEIILKILRRKFPRHRILSEEAGEVGPASDYLWLVDPLDGTNNFFMKNPLFATALALTYQGEIILSVIYAPMIDEFYWAEKNKGAYLNHKKIRVSAKRKLKNAVVTFCSVYELGTLNRVTRIFKFLKSQTQTLRQIGSASLELAFVAAGRNEALVLVGTHPWDNAPGALLAREAGGRVTDFTGHPWTLFTPELIASNGLVHKELQSGLKKYLSR